VPEQIASLVVQDANQVQMVADQVDFVFCAVDMDKEATRRLEESYARAEVPVVSNNSAHRGTPDVPMVIPEVNPLHLQVISAQRRRLGTRHGFIAVKPNCSIQSYVPALHALRQFGPTRVVACTYQAISGAGKTFTTWPEMLDNVIPLIKGEEEKSEQEPLKVWGEVRDGRIVPASAPIITTQCIRVPISDGHLAAVFVDFERKPTTEEMIECWNSYRGRPQELGLPSAPRQFIHYFTEPDRPQTRSERELEHGMAVSVGRLRPDQLFDYKFVCLSHNTLRGAAGGAVLTAELLAAEGWLCER
jgi:aspartate-semialdehyde dehydrogenase